MSGKTVEFKQPGRKPNPNPDPAADKFVSEGEGVPVEPTKRFTIDVPESLHRRVKAQCAMGGVKMADVIRAMLEKGFPEGSSLSQ